MVNSRYRKADELEVMRRMIFAPPPQFRAAVVEVFCDSKAAHSYLRHWSLASAIAKRLDAAATKVCGGHNGIDAREIVPPQACASPSILVGKKAF
jgi:hypothetical protein